MTIDNTVDYLNIIESLLMSINKPLSLDNIQNIINIKKNNQEALSKNEISTIIEQLSERYHDSSIQLIQVASGYRIQIKKDYSPWVSILLQDKPQKYSRAMLETLVLIAYKQPITRGEIEEIRGVGVSTHIIRTLSERGWVSVIGHRDVPGRPALYATTKNFLDYFSIKKIDDLPPLSALVDFDQINPELNFEQGIELQH